MSLWCTAVILLGVQHLGEAGLLLMGVLDKKK
jgi:hypothetical protein